MTLQEQIVSEEQKDAEITSQMDSLRIRIAEGSARTGSEPRAMVNQLNLLSREQSEVRARLSILRTSYSTQEASAKMSLYQGQVAQEQARQAEQQKIIKAEPSKGIILSIGEAPTPDVRARVGGLTMAGIPYYSEKAEPTPTPTQIGLVTGPVISEEQSFWGATAEFVKRTPESFRLSVKGLFEEADVSKGFEYWLAPFKPTGGLIGEEKLRVSGEPLFGTIISEEYLQEKFKPFEGTKFEYEKMMQVTDPSLYERTGVRVSKYTPMIAETGTLIGASVTPAGAGIVSGYLIGRGMKQTIETETILGKGMGIATMGLGFTGIGFTMSGLQQSITRGEISEALAIKPDIKAGVRLDLGKGRVLDYIPEKYRFGGVEVMRESVAISKQIDKNLYAITGEGAVIVRTTEYMTGRVVLYGAKTKFKGLGIGFPKATAGFQPSIALGKMTKEMEFFVKFKTPSKVKGRIDLFAPAEDIRVGGISKQVEDKIFSMSGELKGFQKRWVTREGIEIAPVQFKFDVEDITLLKLVKPTREGMTRFQKPADVTKTPLSKTFQEQVVKQASKPISERPIFETKPSQISSQILKKMNQPMKSDLISKQGDLLLGKQFGVISVIPKISESFINLSKLKTKQMEDNLQKGLGAISPGLRGELLPRAKEKVILVQASSPKLRLKQLQEQVSTGINMVRPRPEPRIPGAPPSGFGFYFPDIKFIGLGGKPGKGREMRKQFQKYQPSLRAIALDIRAKRIPKSYLRGAGAIIERPIVRVKKRRRK